MTWLKCIHAYVQHCFQKKTQATSWPDKHIAKVRYRAITEARKNKT